MKNIFPNLNQIITTRKGRVSMLRIEIPNKDMNDEKANKLISIISAIANSETLEVVIIEE